MGRTARPLAVPQIADAPACFDEFYAEYHSRVLRYATTCFGSEYADEIAQEVMARALVAFDDFDLDQNPWPWLAVVTRNFGRTLVGRLRRCELVQDDAFDDFVGGGWGDPERRLEDQERQRLVAQTLDSLTVSQRRVLLLRLVEGLGFDVIAQLLGCSENAVRQQLFKARHAFSAKFDACGGRSPALLPLAALSGMRRLLRRPDPHLAGVGASGLGAVAASITIGVGLGLLPSPWSAGAASATQVTSRPAAAVTAVRAPVERLTSTGTSAELATAPGAAAGTAAAMREVTLADGPARAGVKVGENPFRPGEYGSLQVKVDTPVGSVVYEAEVRREPGLSAVCLSGSVSCG